MPPGTVNKCDLCIQQFLEITQVIDRQNQPKGNAMKDYSKSFRTVLSATATGLMLGIVPTAATAAESGQVMEEVKVTGTHIRRPQQRDMASPMQTMSAEDIDAQGAKDIPDIIRNLTINTGSEYQVSGLNQPQSAGTSNFNLRGLGLSSTLVLVNGRRQTLSGIAKQDDGSSFVDTNSLVPKIMIQRLDILKDGAAATYGTDAVAGVVNFVTHKDYEGGKIELDYLNDTDSSSYDEYTVSGMYGANLGDNARFVIAASYFDRSALDSVDRDWTEGTALSAMAHPGGFITSAGFQPDPACGADGTFLRFGGILCGMEIGPFFDLMPEEERLNIAGNLTYDLDDSTSAYFEFSYADNEGGHRATPSYPMLRNYPKVSASDPNNTFGEDVEYFGRILGSAGDATPLDFDYETWRIAGELTGTMESGWIWEMAMTHSENDAYVTNGDTVQSRLEAGLAGVGGPNGDTFYSPFYGANTSDEMYDHLIQKSWQNGEASLTTFDMLFTGDLFEIESGTVAMAIGYQFRKEELEVDLDPILNADDFYTLPGGDDFDADRNVHALFTELSVPLADTVELQLAARYEDYGDSLSSLDPKVALLWTPSEQLSLRGSFGTSFRAPSLLQANGRLGANDVINDSANGLSNLFRTINTQGNPDLDPEEADVYNIGLTWSPTANAEVSVDYWRFEYSDMIIKESAQGLVDQAIADFNNGLSNTNALNKVSRAGGDATTFGLITLINTDFLNASAVETDGVDVNASYSFEADAGSFVLGTDLAYVASYDLQVSSNSAKIDGAGSRNNNNFARPVPELRGNVYLTWLSGNHSANVFARYVDEYEDDATGNNIDSHSTVDASYTYTFEGDSGETQITLGAINLFDEEPPEVVTYLGFDVQTHDPRGRLLYLNLKHNF